LLGGRKDCLVAEEAKQAEEEYFTVGQVEEDCFVVGKKEDNYLVVGRLQVEEGY